MKLFMLGESGWKQTQLIYHALAHMNIEGLVLHSPRKRYVCVGLAQDPRDELDIDHCKEKGIGIFRREIGGGTVLIDNDQLFYTLILHRKRAGVPRVPANFFEYYLRPVVESCGEMGIEAEFRPICDLVVKGGKISGNGGGEIGECKVLGGNLLLDFDYEVMARVLSAEVGLRSRFLELMRDNITTVREELGGVPTKEEIYSILIKRFEEALGPLVESELDREIAAKMAELDRRYSSDKWMYQRGTPGTGRELKVREGVYLYRREILGADGRFGITFETENGRIAGISSRRTHPSVHSTVEKLKERLLGRKYDTREITEAISDITGPGTETDGVSDEDTERIDPHGGNIDV